MSDPEVIKVRCEPLNDVAQVEQRWRSLESAADISPFLTWLWIGSWLKLRSCWPNAFEVSAWQGARLVGIALLFEQTTYRAKFIPVNTLYINEAGEPKLDMIIEYNGFLVDAEHETAVTEAMCKYIERHWAKRDEVFISGALNSSATLECLRSGSLQWKTERQSEGRFIDLAALRSGQQEFLATLSKKRRYQIRHSIKSYERFGAILIERAESIEVAKAWYEELKKLHRIHWESKGKHGAFSWPERDLFFTGLIEGGILAGAVDFVRARAGNTTIGILFSLKKGGTIYYLQSGFDYSLEPKAQPGYVVLSLAIQWYTDQGADCFDFLAGDEAYKATLADKSYLLLWGAGQRKSLKFTFIEGLRKAKQLIA